LIKKSKGEVAVATDFAKALLFQKFARLCIEDFLIINDEMSLFLIGTHENTVVWVGWGGRIGGYKKNKGRKILKTF
jgi:hypothetical protein